MYILCTCVNHTIDVNINLPDHLAWPWWMPWLSFAMGLLLHISSCSQSASEVWPAAADAKPPMTMVDRFG